ncbi:MAG: AAA family ATPase [Clostridium perfringens]|nr:AAA family ATPase [Clostridium perfringens]
MRKQITPKEIIYNEDFTKVVGEKVNILEYADICSSIEEALNINKEGYNIYLVDEFSKEKLRKIVDYIEKFLCERDKPKDICYMVTDNIKNPRAVILSNGKGLVLKEKIEQIKDLYYDKIFNFYNSSINEEKEEIINEVHDKRNSYISGLIKKAKEEGFDLKATPSGFAFIPIVDGKSVDEDEYDLLEDESKDNISLKADELKREAEKILEELKNIEIEAIEKLKKILENYIQDETLEFKEDLYSIFKEEDKVLECFDELFNDLESSIINNYSMSFEEDEDKVSEILSKYVVNILVDNSENDCPKVIFDEDPTVNNLLGSIDYENHNGVYTTDVTQIKAGSLIAANDGCLILRLNSLFSGGNAYYYLMKALFTGKVSYDFNKTYLEILSLNGLNPEPIPINTKVILIGDYGSFDILYNQDENFKNIFKIRVEFNPYKVINNRTKTILIDKIGEIIRENNLMNLSKEGINEVGKYLSRKASDKNKIYWDVSEIERVLIMAERIAIQNKKKIIDKDDICSSIYKISNIEEEYIDMYKKHKIIVELKNKMIGSVNGLSVIDLGYLSFGKPLRISCVCTKGLGRIIDSQRESNLSGSIHNKSLSILKGFLNNFLNNYEIATVDFHLSFEQVYGKVEGDSASVAEVIAMISALSKIPVNQNIAVTGSINQFGDIQPIGGVNDKIEGFFNVCSAVDSYKGKGVLIPYNNLDDLILNPKVERAIAEEEFNIYTMENINDAMMVLLGDQDTSFEDIAAAINRELKRYKN